MIEIKTIKVGLLQTNCYILSSENKDAVIIDPGDEAGKIISFLEENSLAPKAILLTHTHFDHIGAVEQIVEKYNIKVCASPFCFGDIPNIEIIPTNESKTIIEGNMEFQVLATPGHKEDSVCYILNNYLFSGDTLFRLGVGRTDLEGGSSLELKQSLKKISSLPYEDLLIFPGHMEHTSLAFERQNNPYMS